MVTTLQEETKGSTAIVDSCSVEGSRTASLRM